MYPQHYFVQISLARVMRETTMSHFEVHSVGLVHEGEQTEMGVRYRRKRVERKRLCTPYGEAFELPCHTGCRASPLNATDSLDQTHAKCDFRRSRDHFGGSERTDAYSSSPDRRRCRSLRPGLERITAICDRDRSNPSLEIDLSYSTQIT